MRAVHGKDMHTCCTTCLAVSIGMAKETPSAVSAFIDEIPTTSPARLTSGPPELPLLMAASVCMNSVLGPAKPNSTACRSHPILTPRLWGLAPHGKHVTGGVT